MGETPTPWTTEDIDRMLELLPILEAPGFEIAVWPKLESKVVDGKVFHQMPYPEYHPVVDQFRALAFGTSCLIDPYAVLPGDPPGQAAGVETVTVLTRPRDMEGATLDQLRRYFVLCVRTERFSEGHIDGQFQSGALVAALRRVRDLRQQMG